MIAFVMALMGCVLIMYKAIWYDQFACPDGFLLRVRPGAWLRVGGHAGLGSPVHAGRRGCRPHPHPRQRPLSCARMHPRPHAHTPVEAGASRSCRNVLPKPLAQRYLPRTY